MMDHVLWSSKKISLLAPTRPSALEGRPVVSGGGDGGRSGPGSDVFAEKARRCSCWAGAAICWWDKVFPGVVVRWRCAGFAEEPTGSMRLLRRRQARTGTILFPAWWRRTMPEWSAWPAFRHRGWNAGAECGRVRAGGFLHHPLCAGAGSYYITDGGFSGSEVPVQLWQEHFQWHRTRPVHCDGSGLSAAASWSAAPCYQDLATAYPTARSRPR